MDAATLYTIVTLTSGQHRTNTREFPSTVQCEAAARLLRVQEPLRASAIFCPQ